MMKKRLLAILLAVILCVSVLPAAVLAVEIPSNAVSLPSGGTASSANGWYRFSPTESGFYEFFADGAGVTFSYRVYQTILSGREIAAAEESLTSAAAELAYWRQMLADGEAQYQASLSIFQDSRKDIEQGRAALEANRARYEYYLQLLSDPSTATDEIIEFVEAYKWQQQKQQAAEDQLKAAQQQLSDARRTLDEGHEQLAAGEAEYNQLRSLVDSSRRGKRGEPWLRYEGTDNPMNGVLFQGSEFFIQVEPSGANTLRCRKLCDAFLDVQDDVYYTEPVYWAAANQITNGVGDGLFSPDSPCTRGQVVTFLWRAFGREKATGMNPFADVNRSAFYYDAVLWAAKNGITNGVDASHFCPEMTCTRAQVVTFLWRALGGEEIGTSLRFLDVRADDYFYYPVCWALLNGVTKGTDLMTFSPHDPCTRGQVVTFLYRAAG